MKLWGTVTSPQGLPSQTYAVEIVSASVPRKRLQRKRSELVERSFAHVCETGGGRRTWLRGLVKVTKRYVVQVAAHNLVLLTRKLFGVGKPRVLQGAVGWLIGMVVWLYWLAILRAGRRYRAWGLIVAI